MKPTYEELLQAFQEYADKTSNDGAYYVPTTQQDIDEAEDAVARAYDVIEAAKT